MIRAAAFGLSLLASPALADCPFRGDQQVLVVQLFFGQTMPRGRHVTTDEWQTFLRLVVTPAFPDGFTVYDGYGQWLDPQRRMLARERTKTIQIALADSDAARSAVSAVTAAYKHRFHQQTVGIISNLACGNFGP